MKSAVASAMLVVALVCVIPASAAVPGPRPGVAHGTRLSNEGSLTRWAHTARKAPIRRAPRPGARQIVSTHFLTEDGYPEVYVALRRITDNRGRTWMRVRIPMRPNGRVGWVRSYGLGPLFRVRTHLIVNRENGYAALFRHGRRVWYARVGTGKHSTPTPAGRFWIREKFRTGDPGGLYGPVAFGTSNYSVLSDWPGGGVIGIHGTNEPGLIPGKPSHGCIRVRNRSVRRLYRLMPVGTPVRIRNSLPS